MKNQYLYVFLLGSMLASLSAKGQLVVESTTLTNLGSIANRNTYTQISAIANSSYSASNGAVFEHSETDADALRVFNTYNANGSNGSTDNFNGPNGSAGVQGISGTVAPNFFNLVLKNGSGSAFRITNTAGINLYNSSTFQNGITTTNRSIHQAGAFRFQAGSSYTGGNTDAQHIDGYVSKIGNTAFTFPVGSATDLRTLSISAITDASTHISTAWITGDASTVVNPSDGKTHSRSSVTGPITSIFNAGFWDYNRIAGSGSVAVTVSIPNLGTPPVASQLRLAGWNGSSWIDLSNNSKTAASGNTENSSLTGVIPEGTTIYALAVGQANPMPDLSPTAVIDNLDFSGKENSRDFAIFVGEGAGVATTAPVTFVVNKISAFDITFKTTNSNSQVDGGVMNQNANWNFTDNGNFIIVTSKANIVIGAKSSAVVGFTLTRRANVPVGTTQNITVGVIGGTGGGETPTVNNTSITSVTAN